VEAATRAVQAHDFNAPKLLQGYDPFVGERGPAAGQRQCITIVPALIANATIVIPAVSAA
jgi:ABC-type multidrug transport system fused ATPase/permease subunit